MRLWLLFASHGTCILAGGLIIRSAGELGDGRGAMAPTKSSRDASGLTAGHGARRVKEARANLGKPPFDAEQAGRLADAMEPGEGAGKARELAAGNREAIPEEKAAALLAWFRDNPAEAAEFIATGALDTLGDQVLVDALRGLSPEEHFALAKTLGATPAIYRVGELLGEKLAALPTSEAAAFFDQVEVMKNQPVFQTLLRGWPPDRTAALLDLALEIGDSRLISQFLQTTSRRNQSAILVEMDSRAELPKSFSGIFTTAPELRGHLYRYADPSVPLDERIAQMGNLQWLRNATPEELRSGALKQISTVDIHELMESGPDYRFAFRHGAMSAEEVLQAVREALPELAAASDYETRVRVFNELAAEDPDAAYALLSHMPAEERNLAVLHQSRWSFRDLSPDAFFAMINLAPGPDSAVAAPQREEAWTAFTGSALSEHGEAYVDWVRALPAGANRTAARASLALTLQAGDQPERAAEFQAP